MSEVEQLVELKAVNPSRIIKTILRKVSLDKDQIENLLIENKRLKINRQCLNDAIEVMNFYMEFAGDKQAFELMKLDKFGKMKEWLEKYEEIL
jgi:hypothetical protein